MPYATEAALDAKWGAEQVSLAAWDDGANARDEARIADALAGASATIDAYIGVRYLLPLTTLAPDGAQLLSDIACDLAIYRLCSTPGTRNEIVKEAKDEAYKRLGDIAQGRASLSLLSADASPIGPEDAVMIANEPQFRRDCLRGL
jgi:phage gp36-like protein